MAMSIQQRYSAWQEINGMKYIQWLGWNREEIQRLIPNMFAHYYEHGVVYTTGRCGYGWRPIPIYDYILLYEELGRPVVEIMSAGPFRATYPVR
jgi:hypothetical protein